MIVKATAGKPVDTAPALSDYDPVVARLDGLIDAIEVNTIATMRAAGAKQTPKFKPQPRPKTAFGQVTHEERSAQHARMVARIKRRKARRDDSTE